MPSANRLLAVGFAPAAAKAIAGATTTDLAVTATGSAITDAYDIRADATLCTTVSASTGVQLPDEDGDFLVFNGGSNALSVYPHSSLGKINNGSAGAAKSIAAGKGGRFVRLDALNWGALLD